jgi:hypothetical protein
MLDILARLNISRWARWGQAEHLKMWRSIPHTTTVSVSTCIRRIPAPHATHFITPPDTKRAHGMHWPLTLSSGVSGLRRDVAAPPRTATKSGRFGGVCGRCIRPWRASPRRLQLPMAFCTGGWHEEIAHAFCIGRLAKLRKQIGKQSPRGVALHANAAAAIRAPGRIRV